MRDDFKELYGTWTELRFLTYLIVQYNIILSEWYKGILKVVVGQFLYLGIQRLSYYIE